MNGTWSLVPAIHMERNKKIEIAGLLRVTVFIYHLLEGSEVDVILTEPQRRRNYYVIS